MRQTPQTVRPRLAIGDDEMRVPSEGRIYLMLMRTGIGDAVGLHFLSCNSFPTIQYMQYCKYLEILNKGSMIAAVIQLYMQSNYTNWISLSVRIFIAKPRRHGNCRLCTTRALASHQATKLSFMIHMIYIPIDLQLLLTFTHHTRYTLPSFIIDSHCPPCHV